MPSFRLFEVKLKKRGYSLVGWLGRCTFIGALIVGLTASGTAIGGQGASADAGPTCPTGTFVHQGKCARLLRVLSYNIAAYMYDLRDQTKPLYGDPEPQLQKLAALIKEKAIDLVGLQEVENGANWHNGVNMHSRLLKILENIGHPMHGKFQNRFNAHGGQFGISLLSRYPIVSYDTHLVSDMVYLQSAGLEFAGQPIRFYNFHPFPGPGACAATTASAFQSAINAYLGQVSFVVGDFNFERNAGCYPAMTDTHIDSCVAAGGGSCLSTVDLTIRTDIPAESLGIDYVFGRFAGAEAERWSVHNVYSDHSINSDPVMSDHFPVFADFIFTTDPLGGTPPAAPKNLRLR